MCVCLSPENPAALVTGAGCCMGAWVLSVDGSDLCVVVVARALELPDLVLELPVPDIQRTKVLLLGLGRLPALASLKFHVDRTELALQRRLFSDHCGEVCAGDAVLSYVVGV